MLPLHSLRIRRDTGNAAQPPAETVDREAGARLALLTSDAARASARRLHLFGGAECAAKFIEFWFPPSHRHGLIALWALSGPPDPAATADSEFVVLLRERPGSDLVQALSFPDSELGMSFLRQQLTARRDPRLALVFWAVPVSIETNPMGEARLSPARPPVSRGAPAAAQVPEPTPRAAIIPRATAPAAPRAAPVGRKIDLLVEARKVLRLRRWRAREEAFQGFSSPPGRF